MDDKEFYEALGRLIDERDRSKTRAIEFMAEPKQPIPPRQVSRREVPKLDPQYDWHAVPIERLGYLSDFDPSTSSMKIKVDGVSKRIVVAMVGVEH